MNQKEVITYQCENLIDIIQLDIISAQYFENSLIYSLYKPINNPSMNCYLFQGSSNQNKMKDLTSWLDLERIGWIFYYEDKREVGLTNIEVLKAAENQCKFGSNFITLSASPDGEGKTKFEAFQVSKQCVNLYSKGFLSINKENPFHLNTSCEIIVEGKIQNFVDIHFFILNV